MAKLRKRFYVVRRANLRAVISLKYAPDASMLAYTDMVVVGPFRTFQLASEAL